MNFTRKQRIKGKPAKHYKEWYDETKQYRVSWRDEAFGVAVLPGFYACVRCSVNGSVYWGFVGRRGLYRTVLAAMDACDRNREIWNKFLAIEGKAKVKQLKELQEHAIFGSGKSSYSMMAELPVWMVSKAPVRLMEILCGKNPIDPSPASKCSDEPSSSEEDASNKDGPACDAAGKEPVLSVTASANPCETKSPVKRAPAAVKDRGKKSVKRTAKRSPSGKKKSKRTTRKSKSGKKRSPSSRKKK